ncbi:unnamed protein product [marine sediment metagenome]|uniref:Uncharacterized protein n=1 Tax=marine sediment metagenome TaxID=412755 RepID=X1V3G4_9ZZZZ
MDTDGTTKKISTSEPRNSRRESWRRAKGFKPKRVKGTTFGHSVGSKNNGKPSRRR